MRPHEVLDAVADFKRRCDDEYFIEYLRDCVSYVFLKGSHDSARLVSYLTQALPTSHGFFQVTANMVPLVQVASECFTEEDTFRKDFAPVARGFVQFEVPVTILDVRSTTLHVSWMYWDMEQEFVAAWADSRWPDGAYRVLEQEVGRESELLMSDLTRLVGHRWQWTGLQHVGDNRRLVLMAEEAQEFFSTMPANAYADEWAESHDWHGNTEDTQLLRILKALWVLMAQRSGEVHTRALDRAGAKRAKRAKRLQLPTEVTVIELRAPAAGPDEHQIDGEGRKFHVRWMVRGHYVWRHCSEHHPLAEPYEKGWRCRVFIHPYAKLAGRIDLPWRMGEKIYRLQR
jgi:hypothetical protein